MADDAQKARLQAATESEMIVLGSRGPESVESYFMGDVSLPVVARAERPVTLVRAGTGEEAAGPASASRVAVALKLRTSGDDLLEFAFHSAAAREVPLVVVHGRSVPLHACVPWGVDHATAEAMTGDTQSEPGNALSPWLEKYPQVDVTESVRLTSPAKAGEAFGAPGVRTTAASMYGAPGRAVGQLGPPGPLGPTGAGRMGPEGPPSGPLGPGWAEVLATYRSGHGERSERTAPDVAHR